MKSTVPYTLAVLFACFLVLVNAPHLMAQQKPVTEIRIGYLRAYEPQLALSVLDIAPEDEGVAGANVAINDNNTTGSFLGQSFTLDVVQTKLEEDVVPVFQDMIARGEKYVLTDISAKQLLSIADLAKENGVLLFNVGSTDDILREEECRSNVFHTAPTRSMLADGLAQYLVWKQWRNWVLLYGSHERDQLFADAIRRAAKRFGAKIVEERLYEDTGTARRTDSGVVQVQRQMPVFTQNLPAHDVVVVADESEVFGSYVPFRTWDPRPVAGTAGLIPSSWPSGQRAVGRLADAGSFREGDRPPHAQQRHAGMDGCPHPRRGRDAHEQQRDRKGRSLHPGREFRHRGLQGTEGELPPVELAASPTGLPR